MLILVTSRFDYCNTLLSRCPKKSLRPLQLFQNSTAHVLTKTEVTVWDAKTRPHLILGASLIYLATKLNYPTPSLRRKTGNQNSCHSLWCRRSSSQWEQMWALLKNTEVNKRAVQWLWQSRATSKTGNRKIDFSCRATVEQRATVASAASDIYWRLASCSVDSPILDKSCSVNTHTPAAHKWRLESLVVNGLRTLLTRKNTFHQCWPSYIGFQ